MVMEKQESRYMIQPNVNIKLQKTMISFNKYACCMFQSKNVPLFHVLQALAFRSDHNQ